MLFLNILPKCCKEKEPKDGQLCTAVHIRNNNMCDADPLDISSNIAQLSKHCLT